MTNAEIAQKLRSHASALAGRGSNLYRVRAFRQAAVAVLGLEAPATCLSPDDWSRLPGIGASLAATLAHFAATGQWEPRTTVPARKSF